jgi:AraC-like DNA-binding protein
VACTVDPPLAWPDDRRRFPLPGAAALVEAFRDEPDDAWAAEIHDLRCRALLLSLLRQAAPPEPADAFRGALLHRLEQRLARPLDLEALARELGVSRRTLSARCRAICGTSPARLLARLRLERARALLHETGLPVKAVAVRCGFANPNHFSTAFRRAFGRPPREEGPLPAQ